MASSSGRQPNFAALNRGRHLCSAGRPSGWALAHILVFIRVFKVKLSDIKMYFASSSEFKQDEGLHNFNLQDVLVSKHIQHITYK